MRHVLPFMIALPLALAVAAQPSTAGAEPQCGAVPEMMLLLDRSGSMAEAIGGQTKAAIAEAAIEELLGSFAGQLRFGLALFPAWPHSSACATAAVNVGPGHNTAAGIKAMLAEATAEGDTPIAASLDAMGVHFAAKTDRPRYIVLITDGQETCVAPPKPLTKPGTCAWEEGNNFRRCGGCGWQFCLPSGNWSLDCEGRYACPYGQTCEADGTCSGPAGGSVSAADAAEQLGQDGIETFVIGFGSKVDAGVLSAVASAGGTTDYYQADNLTQLEAALNEIADAISCCGNGTIDGGEACDTQIPAGNSGACPTICDDGDPCTQDARVGEGCQQRCEHTPMADCSSCGDGEVGPDESCDIAIAEGQVGACATSCDDGDPCTSDTLSGGGCATRCMHDAVAADPTTPDGCCPAGEELDVDCVAYDQVGGGCDCRTGASDVRDSWALLLWLVAAACLLERRRRGR